MTTEQTVTLTIGPDDAGDQSVSISDGRGFTGNVWFADRCCGFEMGDDPPFLAADLASCAWMAALLLRLPHELGDALRGRNETYEIRRVAYREGEAVRVLHDEKTIAFESVYPERYATDIVIDALLDHLAQQPGTAAE